MRITQFFASIGAPLRNPRYSWGAGDNQGRLFLRVWKDQIKPYKGGQRVQVFWKQKRGSHGFPEREAHVKLLASGTPTYGIVCVAKDPHSSKARVIESYDPKNLLRLGVLTEDEKRVYAQIEEIVPLDELGIESHSTRNPAWTRDELILALDLYLSRKPAPDKTSREVEELSQLLNKAGRILGWGGSGTYRNPNGVYMKLMNFRRFDPAFKDRGKTGLARGNKDEEVVWNEFAKDPKRLKQLADGIRSTIVSGDQAETSDIDPDFHEAPEGALLSRQHLYRERNRKLVATKKKQALKKHGRLFCEACGFDFGKHYGARAKDIIDCHHTKPVHTLPTGGKTRLEDLVLLCANCHRVVHSTKNWLSVDDLKILVSNQIA